jgi:hypothetical protein
MRSAAAYKGLDCCAAWCHYEKDTHTHTHTDTHTRARARTGKKETKGEFMGVLLNLSWLNFTGWFLFALERTMESQQDPLWERIDGTV